MSTVEFLVKVWEGNRDFLEVPHESTGTGSFFRDMTVFPLEARSFEKKQIFQEEQKTIFAIIKPVLGIFF